MTWSIQFTIWALPPLLAALVVLRDVEYLWPRRREGGAMALMAASFGAGLWSLLALVAAISPPLEVKAALERAAYVPGALTPVAWVAFAWISARRGRLTKWPLVLLYAATLVTVGLAVFGTRPGALVREVALVDAGGTLGLSVTFGSWHWVHLGIQLVAVAAAASILVRHLLRTRTPWKIGWVVLGAACAIGPILIQVATTPGAVWRNQTPAGFAVGATVLGFGLLRQRMLDLGPVARTLVMDGLPDPIVVLDGRGRIVDTNRAAQTILGLRPYGDVPVALGTLWASSRSEAARKQPLALDVVEGEAGPQRLFEVTVTHLGEQGRHGHSALLMRDVTEQERMEHDLRQITDALRAANADLKRLANTDVLTGLANRRRFLEVLEGEIERAERYDRPLSLVLVDMDHFKQVNDTHGHAGGDQVLRAAAGVLRSVCRDVDLAARVGGEEFAILLPETAAVGAERVAERARAKIEGGHHRAPSGAGFRITASAGVATFGLEVASAEALLQSADDALYRAKAGGRNRVVAGE
jgi:diguanylate cyclase (GGDEF)-like protein